MTRTPVLIVGGGLVGLTTSLLLTRYGVPSVLVEKHPTTSPQPKARRFDFRTMEVFRSLGITAEVERAAADLADHQGMRVGRTLVDAEALPGMPPADLTAAVAASPALPCLCAQDRLEPVLRDLAVARGGDLRFGTELLDFVDDGDTIRATVGGRHEIRADYLVAADGARSPVREALGIPRSGHGVLGRATTVYFQADLTDLVRGREFNLCQVDGGAFASVNGTDRWLFYTDHYEPDRLRRAIGADVDLTVLSVQSWEPTMKVADRFSAGRVFLAGDAAHVMPPFAALGANTGIQDAHNLAWKLAAVLSNRADPRLLDSYHEERHAIGWFAAEQSSLRSGDLRSTGRDDPRLANPLVLALSWAYPEPGRTPPRTDRMEFTGRPGSRVPHAWIVPEVSTLDLCGDWFTVLANGTGWHVAAAEAGLVVHDVGDLTGLPPGGAMLVRPDTVIEARFDALQPLELRRYASASADRQAR
jgi:putative polyketide hydroxylase